MKGDAISQILTGACAELHVDVQHLGTEEVLCLQGDLDLSSVPSFVQETASLRESSPRCVVVDLHGLKFLDCAGLGVLVRLSNEVAAGGGRLTIRRPTRSVAKLIELVGPPDWT